MLKLINKEKKALAIESRLITQLTNIYKNRTKTAFNYVIVDTTTEKIIISLEIKDRNVILVGLRADGLNEKLYVNDFFCECIYLVDPKNAFNTASFESKQLYQRLMSE